MRVLLTGATGFLGSHLTNAFVSDGHEIAVVARPSPRMDRLSGILSRIRLIDVSSLEESTMAFRPHAVVHAATCYGKRGEPLRALEETNVELPSRLLKYAVDVRAALFVNSDTTLPADLSNYAHTKAQFVQSSRPLVNGDIRFANVRLESLYGPGDDDGKFVTQVVQACVREDLELRLTPGDQARDFLFIDDAVAAYRLLLQHAADQLQPWQDYGLGTGVATTIRDLVETVKRESGSRIACRFGALPYRPRELMRSCANAVVLERLGWRHRTGLVEGLRKVIAFERAACGC
jgi:nucleoside-diphosphate-sugar epimerase